MRLAIIVLVFIILSCENTIENPLLNPQEDWDFFPATYGYVRTYEVTLISYKGSTNDTSTYQLREQVYDSIAKNGEPIVYLLKRSKKFPEQSEFITDSIWPMRRNDRYISVSENGNNLIKLVFPITNGREWDGNRLMNRPLAKYEYRLNFSNALEGNYDFLPGNPDLVWVQIANIPRNIVSQNQQYEVYGKGVGLIEKKSVVLEFCTVNCESTGQINTGTILTQKLIANESD